MKTARNITEWLGTVIGLGLLFGGLPEMEIGLRWALLAVLSLAGVVGMFLLVIVVQNVRQPPYNG